MPILLESVHVINVKKKDSISQPTIFNIIIIMSLNMACQILKQALVNLDNTASRDIIF